MRDEQRTARVAAGLGLAATLAFAAPAGAQQIYGSLQLQYQKSDINLLQFAPDGSSTLLHRESELWLQSYEANQQAYPRPDLLVQSQLRFSRQADVNGPNQVTTPQGSMRLFHPWFNVFGSYQPTVSHTEVRTPVLGDSVITSRLDTHFSEAQLVGHFGPPKLPQLDLSWIRRMRDDAGATSKEYGRQQSARLSYQQDWWNAYAGITQQRSERRGLVSTTPLDQRVANAGGSIHFAPRPTASASLVYDLSDTRGGFVGQRAATTQSHSLNAAGDWRFAPRWSADLSWIYHHSDIEQTVRSKQDDQEGSALVSWEPQRRTRLTGGAGVRTLHRFLLPDRFIKYVTAIAATDGMVRPGWQMAASVSHSTNWDPARGNYSTETIGGSTRMDARRRAHLEANWQLSTNSDTATAGQNMNIDWGTRLDLTPLRNLTVTGGLRSTRIGSGLFHATGVTRTRSAGFSWRPATGVTLVGSYASTGLLPFDQPRTVTRSLSAQYARSSRLQLTGIWSRSSQDRSSAFAGGLLGREVVSGRAQSSLSRSLTASAGISVSDPGHTQASKQYDAVMTWSFGR